MEIIGFIFTIIIFAALIVGINKKLPLTTLLLFLTVVCMIFVAVTTGTLLGDATSGSVAIDLFNNMANSFTANLAGMGATMIFILAYAELMKTTKATYALANLICKPLKKIHSVYLLMIILAIVVGVLKLPISAGPALIALMLSIFAPVLKQKNIPLASVIPAFVLPLALCWGPADTGLLTGASLAGLSDSLNMSSWFIEMHLPLTAIAIVSMCVLMIVTYKKGAQETAAETAAQQEASSSEEKIPAVYALLPLLPVIILFVFSPLITGISISVVGCIILCIMLTLLIQFAATRSGKTLLNTMNQFYTALSTNLCGIGLMIIAALMFSAAITSVGGMKFIANALASVSLPPFVLVIIVVLFSAILNMLIGSFFGSLGICIPLSASICATTGIDPVFMCYMVVFACCVGAMFSPANPSVLIATKEANITVTDLIKKNAIPAWGTLIIVTVAGCLMYM